MLSITLDNQTQTDLFQDKESNFPNFELQVVNEGLFAEVRLYYLANRKVKKKKQIAEKNSSRKENSNSLSAEHQHVIKLAV